VHQRLTLAGAGQHSINDCISRMIELVKPGGLVELVEAFFDESWESGNGPALKKFDEMMLALMEMVGVGYGYATKLADLVKESGLVDVEERVFVVRYGQGVEDKGIREKSVKQMVGTAKVVSGIANGLLKEKMSDDELRAFPDLVRRELEERGAVFRYVGVWGRKPAR